MSSSVVPISITLAAEAMSSFERPWALCGGWAIDAWLGRQTREHGDTDITVAIQDAPALYDHLAGWHLVAHDAIDPGPTEELWRGRELAPPAHLHARPPGPENLAALRAWTTPPYRAAKDGLDFDFELGSRDGDQLVLSDDPPIRTPLDGSIRQSPWHIPTLVPELLLFWKATAYHFNPRFAERLAMDEADFRALLPQLAAERRAWLHDAVAILHPDHPWLPAVAELAPPTETA
jgi:hypothetical protein